MANNRKPTPKIKMPAPARPRPKRITTKAPAGGGRKK